LAPAIDIAPPTVDDTNCKADCEIHYAAVTVYEWQRVVMTATSTVIKYLSSDGATPVPDPLMRHGEALQDTNKANEFLSKGGIPYTTLAIAQGDANGELARPSTTLEV
jgi:hypothetical protein